MGIDSSKTNICIKHDCHSNKVGADSCLTICLHVESAGSSSEQMIYMSTVTVKDPVDKAPVLCLASLNLLSSSRN